MLLKLEDRNLYILNEMDDKIVVTYSDNLIEQNIKTKAKIKTYKDDHNNSFNIAELANGLFCIYDIKIKQQDLIQSILVTAVNDYNTETNSDLLLYKLSMSIDKPVSYDFGNLIIKTKNHFYDLSIYDKSKSNSSVTFKLGNNITVYTNLKFEKLQANENIIFGFKNGERIRYLQVNKEKADFYFPVNENYKVKLMSVIDQLLANHV